MDNRASQTPPLQERFADVFSRLPEQNIEQFYAHYQIWTLRRRIPLLETQLEILQEHIIGNQQIIQDLRPSAIALAVLARLQSKGVEDRDVLDHMLEQGENWLDRMMQRLDYCEQVEDFIQGDYTQWCINSLEGAYDWIDSLRGSPTDKTETTRTEENSNSAETLITEEILLQKLKTDDEEAMWEVTRKPRTTAPLAEIPEQIPLSDEESPVLLESSEMLTASFQAEAEQTASNESLTYAEETTQTYLAHTEEEETAEPTQYEQNTLQHLPATHELLHFDQPGIMDDWITALQADPRTSIEVEDIEEVEFDANRTGSQEMQEQTGASEADLANADLSLSAENSLEISSPLTQEEVADETVILQKDKLHIPPMTEAETGTAVSTNLSGTDSTEEEPPVEIARVEFEALAQDEITLSAEAGEATTLQQTEEIPVDLIPATELEMTPALNETASEDEVSDETDSEILAPVQSEDIIDETRFTNQQTLQTIKSDEEEGEDTLQEEFEASVPEKIQEEMVAPIHEETSTEEATRAETATLAEVQEPVELTEAQASTQVNEIEAAALTNTLLDTEETEGQLAWYEYLEIEAKSHPVHSNIEEHLTQEEIQPTGTTARLQETPAAYELTETSTAEQTLMNSSGSEGTENAEEEPNKAVTWEAWNADADSDKTLPFLLKDIAQAYKQQEATPAASTLENTPSLASATEEQTLPGQTIEQATQELNLIQQVESVKTERSIEEEDTVIFSEYSQTPAANQEYIAQEQVTTSVETRTAIPPESRVVTNNPGETGRWQMGQPGQIYREESIQAQEKPRKLRFWQRWFRRKRKKVV